MTGEDRACPSRLKLREPSLSARREFLHVDDLADACLFLMNNYSGAEILNVYVGEDISIRELAELVRSVVGYSGDTTCDTTKPDGTPRKLLAVGKLRDL